MSVTVQITFDCHDPGQLASFWAAALDAQVQPPPSGFESWDAFLDNVGMPPEARNDRSAVVDPEGIGPRLFFQKVPEPKVVKNRLHLDLRAAPGLTGDERLTALRARADELVALGATVQSEHEAGGMDEALIIMRDPEGNEFCLD